MPDSKRRQERLIVLFTALALLLICARCGWYWYYSWPGPDEHDALYECEPEMEALLIDLDVFPPGWEPSGVRQDYYHSRKAIGTCQQYFDPGTNVPSGGAGASYTIDKYNNTFVARLEYQRFLKDFYHVNEKRGDTQWETPDHLLLITDVPDDYNIECHVEGIFHERRCVAVLRYGLHIVIFRSYISEEAMTEDDLIHIIQAIDDKMIEQGIVEGD